MGTKIQIQDMPRDHEHLSTNLRAHVPSEVFEVTKFRPDVKLGAVKDDV